MRLPLFLIALVSMILLSTVLGIAAGFSLWRLVLFVLSVSVVLQLAYVALVAITALVWHSQRSAALRPRLDAPPPTISQKTDA